MGRSPGQRHPEPEARVQHGQGPMANFPCAQPQVPAALSAPELQLSLTGTQCYAILNFLLFDLKELLVWGTCKHKLCIFFEVYSFLFYRHPAVGIIR